jgi:hypothetical protein
MSNPIDLVVILIILNTKSGNSLEMGKDNACICILFSFGATALILGLGLPPWNSPFHFGLLDLRHSVGLLGQVISSSQGLYLYTHTHAHQTFMPWVRFEPTIPASERAKTVHALDRSATVTGCICIYKETYIL